MLLRADDALPALPASERALMRPMVPRRAREFAWGRVAARRALENLGVATAPLLPDADRVPTWPAGVTGSISHSGRLCGAAVARTPGSVGFDIEQGVALDPDLWEEILTAPELDRLFGLPADDRPSAALGLFTAKEAVFKAHFPVHRQMFGFADLDIATRPDGWFTATFRARNGPAHPPVTGRTHRGDGWTASGVFLTVRYPES